MTTKLFTRLLVSVFLSMTSIAASAQDFSGGPELHPLPLGFDKGEQELLFVGKKAPIAQMAGLSDGRGLITQMAGLSDGRGLITQMAGLSDGRGLITQMAGSAVSSDLGSIDLGLSEFTGS